MKASEENEQDNCDNHFEYVKRNTDPKSTFVPPSGRDTSFDFNIDSITNEILQNDKKINSLQIYPQKNYKV